MTVYTQSIKTQTVCFRKRKLEQKKNIKCSIIKGEKEWKTILAERAKLGGVKLTGAFESAQSKSQELIRER